MIANLIPACDRCGHSTDLDDLRSDGLGHVCPKCRAGALPKPKRIQLRRHAGWRKPPGTIVVARPSRWGNPFTVADAIDANYENPQRACVAHFRAWMEGAPDYFDQLEVGGRRHCRRELTAALPELRGHDLACWCPLDQPCHADVLLELASGVS